ncbi:MAG TPA: hypothetical protein VHH36_02650, partial [Candidatus Thermoplasmatota archaeon]|nr:hypothetical protein [Candidatus Thermoplasmatota archaeon]
DGVYQIPVTAWDAQGRAVATATATITAASGKTAVEGTTLAIPSSSAIAKMRLRNFSVDKLFPARLDNDVLVLHASDAAGRGWTVAIQLEDVTGVAYATTLRAYGDASDTTYVPRNGTRLPLANLDMDLLDPVGSLQWVRSAGAANPSALYRASGLGAGAQLAVQRMADETSGRAIDIGLFSVDVVVE